MARPPRQFDCGEKLAPCAICMHPPARGRHNVQPREQGRFHSGTGKIIGRNRERLPRLHNIAATRNPPLRPMPATHSRRAIGLEPCPAAYRSTRLPGLSLCAYRAPRPFGVLSPTEWAEDESSATTIARRVLEFWENDSRSGNFAVQMLEALSYLA
jgi:hypothetical protein